MKTSRQTRVLPNSMPASPLAANAQKFALAAARLQAHAFKAAMQYQIEALTFVKHRYEMDMRFVDDLVASDEFNDTFDVFTTFMQNAATDYAAEASKVASIGSRFASETARRVRKEAEEAVDDIVVAATA
jgi:hypothetical protein